MIDVKKSDLIKALYIAASRTYYKAIIKATPGVGIVSDGWTLEIEGSSIVIQNVKFDDIIGYLEYGTGLYGPKGKMIIIKPKDKKSLRWKTGPGDSYGFAKEIHNPGIKARRFLQKILNDPIIQAEFEIIFEKELTKRIKLDI